VSAQSIINHLLEADVIESDFSVKDVLPTPLNVAEITNKLELCIDELTTHRGDKQLTLPFTVLLSWINNPMKKAESGWSWPVFKEQVEKVYIPLLINNGMEIQATDLKLVMLDMDRFQQSNRGQLGEAADDGWKDLIGPEGVLPGPNEVEYTLERQDEDIDYRKDFTDDPRTVRWITNQLAKGNEYAWFCARVVAKWFDPVLEVEVEGDTYLGGCSYRSAKDFMHPKGYWPDLKNDAYTDLINKIKSKRAAASM
jgi:hypothetical protein